MPSVVVSIEGRASYDALITRLQSAPVELSKGEFQAFVLNVLNRAVAYCPVDTEALAASGRIVQVQTGDNQIYDIYFGDDGAPYALWVHEGHRLVIFGRMTDRYIAPNKFLEKAVLDESGNLESILSAGLQRIF